MGRNTKSKAEKIAAGTYRPDRDKSLTVEISGEIPEPPDTMGERGRELWGHAYAQPWVTVADKTLVQLVAEKLDERETVAEQFHLDPSDFRHQRTLKEIDRDILHGLDQLLLTPNARRRAGIETASAAEPELTQLELIQKLADGEISREDFERQMEPHRLERERELSQRDRAEVIEDIRDAHLRTLRALADPDGHSRKLRDAS